MLDCGVRYFFNSLLLVLKRICTDCKASDSHISSSSSICVFPRMPVTAPSQAHPVGVLGDGEPSLAPPTGAQQYQGTSGHLIPHGDRRTDFDWRPQRSLEPCSLCPPTIKDVQCHMSVHSPGLGVASIKRKEWFVKTGTRYIYTTIKCAVLNHSCGRTQV